MRIALSIILTALCLLGAMPEPARAQLTGSAELRYGEVSAERNAQKVVEGSYFAQQYSMLYSTEGLLAKGRAGKYNIDLGYEWNSLSNDMSGLLARYDGSDTTDKILFRGDITVAPGGLPFRLHLYSKDLKRSTFTQTSYNSLFDDFDSLGERIPRPVGNISNGQAIRTGATLLLGIRNGSYLGRYRDVLSHLPRILVDYTEDYVKDLPGSVHYRNRNLAFISLNKKDNWLHYRMFEHRDLLRPEMDFDEETILLGTVDHFNQRQWIKLTNWIQVSADLSFTSGKRINDDNQEFEDFDLHLFGRTNRSTWQGTSFNTFRRHFDETGLKLERVLDIPLYLQGQIDQDTAWRTRFRGYQDRDDDLVTGARDERGYLFASARGELFRRGRYILVPELEVETKQGDHGEGGSFRAGVEFYSNRKFNPKYDLFGAYTVALFSGEGDGGFDTSFLEHKLEGRIETDINAYFRTGFEQDIVFGKGELDQSVAENIDPFSDDGFDGSRNGNGLIDGTIFRSTSSWFGEHHKERLSNRLGLRLDYLSNPDDSDTQVGVEHKLVYDLREIRANWDNRFLSGGGDLMPSNSAASSGGFSALGSGEVETMFFTTGRLSYQPSRTFEASTHFDYEWLDTDTGGSSVWHVGESIRYSILKVNGIIRKLAEFKQQIRYEQGRSVLGEELTRTEFGVSADYFPTRVYMLGTEARYLLNSGDTESDTWVFVARAGADFSKLQVSLDYVYGDQDQGAIGERNEQRWEVRVKKTF